MPIKEKTKHILAELKGHAPFTLFGAALGIIFMLLFKNIGEGASHTLFGIFHPAHVVLSAMVTASMFKIHAIKKQIVLIIVVGYVGSIGVATLSDIVIPHLSSSLLGLHVPGHAEMHQGHHEDHENHENYEGQEPGDEHKIHLAFIEEWYIINPAAFLGIAIALLLPRTKFPHAAHVLISTWASMSYLLMDIRAEMTISVMCGIMVTLFIATWLPCCISDIIFPLLFAKSDLELTESCACKNHKYHSHPHEHTGECPTGKVE